MWSSAGSIEHFDIIAAWWCMYELPNGSMYCAQIIVMIFESSSNHWCTAQKLILRKYERKMLSSGKM